MSPPGRQAGLPAWYDRQSASLVRWPAPAQRPAL